MTRNLLRRSVTHGIVPGLAGGPWAWQRWAPASPWAHPPAVVMTLGWVALAAVVAVRSSASNASVPVWLVAAGYAVACQVPIYLMRSSGFTALELAQTLRYFPDLVVVLALLAAVASAPQPRTVSMARRLPRPNRRNRLLAVAFVASSLYSTATFMTSWRDNPAQPYLQNAAAGLAQAHGGSRPRCSTKRSTHWSFSAWRGRRTSPATCSRCCPTGPNSLLHNRTPHARQPRKRGGAQVTWVRTILSGPDPQCGYLVQPTSPCACPWTDLCCPPTGPPRSTTSPTAKAR